MAEYKSKEVDISFSLLLELMDALKGYGSDVVVIGGWAPYFLLRSFSDANDEHVGSLDADLALNFRGIPEEAYETILETIHRLGYAQRKNAAGKSIPASFEKTVTVGSVPYVMQVDFLAGEYGGECQIASASARAGYARAQGARCRRGLRSILSGGSEGPPAERGGTDGARQRRQ